MEGRREWRFMNFMKINLFTLSSSSLERKLRGGFLVRSSHFEKNLFYLKLAV
jgi:hypothetical protein